MRLVIVGFRSAEIEIVREWDVASAETVSRKEWRRGRQAEIRSVLQ
jgi:hypothetical protein